MFQNEACCECDGNDLTNGGGWEGVSSQPRRFGGMKVQFGKRKLDRFPVMRLENKLFVKIVPRELKLL